jgi:hypothetical protein
MEPMNYHNQLLMDDLNSMMIRIKGHLFGLAFNYPKPTLKELDELTNKLIEALKRDKDTMIKY